MMSEKLAGFALEPEHAHRQPSDRARHAIAVKVEHRRARRANVLERVHFHAIDDGQEILAREVELAHRLHQARDLRSNSAVIKRVDLAPPLAELTQPFGPWPT